jgi:valyl-tRNA synthetase
VYVLGRPEDRAALTAAGAVIARVANVAALDFVESEAGLPPCAIAIVDGRTVYAPFASLVDDVAGEAARLEKRRAKVEAEVAKARGKLANENFVANAPPEVVEQERERLDEFGRQVARLGEQLRRLAASA